MRALVCKQYGPPSQLTLDELDDPKPSKGQILIKVKAAGINFPDVLSIEGKYQVKTEPPFIPGNEASGIIEAVGEGVERF
jgi:NADPH2:quinone reductase